MKKEKLVRTTIRVLAALVVFYAVFVFSVNRFIIPKVVIPKAREFLESDAMSPLKISIANIRFDPISGFLLKDVRLYTKDGSPMNYIISAKAVDIDLAWLSLLRKQVVIRRFDMVGADFRVSRNGEGVWNFHPLTELDFMDRKEGRGFKIKVKELRIIDGTLDYSDSFKTGNSITRRFSKVSLSLISLKEGYSRINFSARSADKPSGYARFALLYCKADKTGKGSIELSTKRLDEYWDYYLDDMLKPWNLKSKEVNLKAIFSFSEGKFSLNGDYKLDDSELSFGDLHLKGDASVKHRLDYDKSVSDKVISTEELSLEDASFLAGENVFISKGECLALINGTGVQISNLEGMIFGRPVSYKGNFSFGETKTLSLKGQISGIDNTFDLRMPDLNSGQADLQVYSGYSKFSLKTDITDLKDLVFSLKAEGDLNLSDLAVLFGLHRADIEGKITVSGAISGEMDKVRSLNGGLVADINGLSIYDIKPKSFILNASVKDGLLQGNIPKFAVYDGTIEGIVRLDPERWGIEVNIDKCRLESLAEENDQLSGMKGELSANFAAVGKWRLPETIEGGGYIDLLDCNLRRVPVFIAMEKGIGTVLDDFSMPDFKEMKTSFYIEDKKINMRSACRSPMLNIEMSGYYDFSGMSEITGGANVSRLSIFKTARQIMIPPTLGFDLIKDGIEVKVSGKWPDLKQETIIKPLRVLNEVFGFMNSITWTKYSLDELWGK